MVDSPLKWMERGEIAYDPTYDTPPVVGPTTSEDGGSKEEERDGDGNTMNTTTTTTNTQQQQKVLIPNPFIVEEHFEAAILGLEDRIRSKERGAGDGDGAAALLYDPDDTSNPEPTPINPVILPDLYLGWGDAKVTHTKRECLRNRLFAVLLTKLSYNYERRKKKDEGSNKDHDDDDDDDDDDSYFIVRMNGNDCIFPDEFIEALLDSGHSIEVCPRSALTTFGVAVCVKEKDDSWTNIPIAFFFRSGYESSRRRPAYFSPLHGGIDLKIEGPLVGFDESTGKSRKCDIQFYMAIEGMCGWHSNHNADVPWIKSVSTTTVYNKEEALTAIRMSGILACTFNQIGTEMELPFGGYGVLGVCNDTAAIIDFAVRGETNMYPLLSTGRFLMHTAKHLMKFHNTITSTINTTDDDEDSDSDDMKKAANDTLRLASAACNMQSDIHCSPNEMIGAARRYRSNYPTSYFQITKESKDVMEELSNQYHDIDTKLKGTV